MGIRRATMRKLMDQDKYNILGKAKDAHASKAKEGLHSLLPIGKQVLSHFQESRAAQTSGFLGKTNAIPLNFCPSSFFLPVLWLSIFSNILQGTVPKYREDSKFKAQIQY